MTNEPHPENSQTGGCQCGSVRYHLTGAPLTLYACYCTECQAQSASGFGMSMRVHRKDVAVDGNTATWRREPGAGNVLECIFCPQCGTRLFHQRPKYPDTLNIKAGSLDEVANLTPVGHIWTASKPNWVTIPQATYQTPHQPPGYEEMIALWRQQHPNWSSG